MQTNAKSMLEKRLMCYKLFGILPLSIKLKAKTSKLSTIYSLTIIIFSVVLTTYGMANCNESSLFTLSGISETLIIFTPPLLVMFNVFYRNSIKKTLNILIHVENKLLSIGILPKCGSHFSQVYDEVLVAAALTSKTGLIFYNFGACLSLLPSLLFLLAISLAFHLQNYLFLFLFARRFIEINKEIEQLQHLRISENEFVWKILALMKSRRQLCCCMEFYTKPLGFQIMFLVLGNVFFFITAIYMKLNSLRNIEEQMQAGDYAPMGMVALDTFVLIMLIRKSKLVTDASNATGSLIKNAMRKCPNELFKYFELFTLQVVQNKAAFHFFGIFNLDYSLLYEAVALITSYTIVAIQLEGSLENGNKEITTQEQDLTIIKV